ncbi:MAG: hypothetical protein LBU32_26530 [Clostridiales bacterium]|nr:hypothetical protein [Clostridiales bacterium]
MSNDEINENILQLSPGNYIFTVLLYSNSEEKSSAELKRLIESHPDIDETARKWLLEKIKD